MGSADTTLIVTSLSAAGLTAGLWKLGSGLQRWAYAVIDSCRARRLAELAARPGQLWEEIDGYIAAGCPVDVFAKVTAPLYEGPDGRYHSGSRCGRTTPAVVIVNPLQLNVAVTDAVLRQRSCGCSDDVGFFPQVYETLGPVRDVHDIRVRVADTFGEGIYRDDVDFDHLVAARSVDTLPEILATVAAAGDELSQILHSDPPATPALAAWAASNLDRLDAAAAAIGRRLASAEAAWRLARSQLGVTLARELSDDPARWAGSSWPVLLAAAGGGDRGRSCAGSSDVPVSWAGSSLEGQVADALAEALQGWAEPVEGVGAVGAVDRQGRWWSEPAAATVDNAPSWLQGPPLEELVARWEARLGRSMNSPLRILVGAAVISGAFLSDTETAVVEFYRLSQRPGLCALPTLVAEALDPGSLGAGLSSTKPLVVDDATVEVLLSLWDPQAPTGMTLADAACAAQLLI